MRHKDPQLEIMKHTKRNRHIVRLNRLLVRVNESNVAPAWSANMSWVRKQIQRLENEQKYGLHRDEMILANGMWKKHSKKNQPN